MDDVQIFLASQSPRRRELLQQIGVRYQVLQVEVDECIPQHVTALEWAQHLALAKAQAGRQCLPASETRPVLGADTLVVCNGHILGKPRDREQGLAMLAQLSGHSHEVITAVAVVDRHGEQLADSRSQVRMRAISSAEAAAYWATGEPADKAGGYAIQGRGAIFVAELTGSYSAVMGLPLFETAQLLTAVGVPLLLP